jgi:hypothetical protein
MDPSTQDISLGAGSRSTLATYWKSLALASLSYVHARTVATSGVVHPDHFAGLAQSGKLTEESLVQILQGLGPGVTEVMAHPGYPESLSDTWPQSRRYERQGDLAALTSPRVKRLINDLGIKLLSYGEADHRV